MTITPRYLHGDQDRPQPSMMGDAYRAGMEDARAGRVPLDHVSPSEWYLAGFAFGCSGEEEQGRPGDQDWPEA